MLKLTNSFCRFFIVTCENYKNKAHVRITTNFIGGKKCGGECVEVETRRYFHSSQHLSKQNNSKKKSWINIPPLNDQELNKSKKMAEPLQPTVNHVSYGGDFTVSSDSDDGIEDFCNNPMNPTETQPCVVPPNFRVWETVGVTTHGSLKFKVMSYNMLAQYLLACHPYLYTECSPVNLKWKVRAARLYEEIVSLSPDILCLQEVQVSHLKTFYSKFEEIGYFGIFKQKTGQRQDGCAIYFKQSMFEMRDHISVEFYQPELPILNRDNIGLIVKLEPLGMPGSPLVVATTHLLYNPKRTDVRLAQIQLFLAEIDRFSFYSNEKGTGHLPIIMTGDLNSMPESAVIQLLDRGHVSASCYRDSSDWQRIGVTDNCQHLSVYLDRQDGKDTEFCDVKIHNSELRETPPSGDIDNPNAEEFSVFFNSGELGHSLRLVSVYDKYKNDGVEEASTFQDFWVTVDYIYFSCYSNLRLTERWRLPTTLECEVLGRLPNDVYGSDHLALAALFELVPPVTTSSYTNL